jgi:hypothetical protein
MEGADGWDIGWTTQVLFHALSLTLTPLRWHILLFILPKRDKWGIYIWRERDKLHIISAGRGRYEKGHHSICAALPVQYFTILILILYWYYTNTNLLTALRYRVHNSTNPLYLLTLPIYWLLYVSDRHEGEDMRHHGHGAHGTLLLTALNPIHAVRTSDGNQPSSVLCSFALCSFRPIPTSVPEHLLRASGEAGKTEISPSHLVWSWFGGGIAWDCNCFPSQSAGR